MEQTSRELIKFWAKKINDYAHEQGLAIDPLPNLVLVGNDSQANNKDDLLIPTGNYAPSIQQITLFIDNRHLKDIIRSYCHELIHHAQNIDNSDYIRRIFSCPENVIDSPMLEEIEGEAYLKGNLLFRKFTEQFKKQIKNKAGNH